MVGRSEFVDQDAMWGIGMADRRGGVEKGEKEMDAFFQKSLKNQSAFELLHKFSTLLFKRVSQLMM